MSAAPAGSDRPPARVLFVSWAWPSHLFPMVPLAWAMRLAGQEVLLACPPSLVPVATRTGLPVATVGRDIDLDPVLGRLVSGRREGPRPRESGRPRTPLDMFVALADEMLDDLLALARGWRADVLVHDPTTYAAPAVARALGVPSVRHLWGIDFAYQLRHFEEAAFTPMYQRLGLDGPQVSGATPTIDPASTSTG